MSFTWSADGGRAAYYVRVADSTGNTIVSQQVTNTSGNLSLASLKEGRALHHLRGRDPRQRHRG